MKLKELFQYNEKNKKKKDKLEVLLEVLLFY